MLQAKQWFENIERRRHDHALELQAREAEAARRNVIIESAVKLYLSAEIGVGLVEAADIAVKCARLVEKRLAETDAEMKP
jgi:hypothetical protein